MTLKPGETVTTFQAVLGRDVELEADDRGVVSVYLAYEGVSLGNAAAARQEFLGSVRPKNEADLDAQVEALVREWEEDL